MPQNTPSPQETAMPTTIMSGLNCSSGPRECTKCRSASQTPSASPVQAATGSEPLRQGSMQGPASPCPGAAFPCPALQCRRLRRVLALHGCHPPRTDAENPPEGTCSDGSVRAPGPWAVLYLAAPTASLTAAALRGTCRGTTTVSISTNTICAGCPGFNLGLVPASKAVHPWELWR